MSVPVRLWLELSHHAAFRIGGWAFVRADGADVSGQAGGARGLDAERAALEALLFALKPLQGRAATLHTASALIAAVPSRLAAADQEPPTENLDLWARAAAALKGVQVIRAPSAPGTPPAFAAAWAELARDKAKDRGPFAAPIPRSNLAKAGV